MSNQSQFPTSFQPDLPLIIDALYRSTNADRSYIDSQVRGLQQVLGGVIGGSVPISQSIRFLSLTQLGNNADVNVVDFEGWYWVRMINLGADRNVVLPAGPVDGMVVVVKDGDGSLAVHNIVINGNGNTIDGAATYTMTAVQNGLKGSVSFQFDANAPNPGWFFF